MNKVRTGGMTTIGVLNIVFGAIGALLCLLVVVGGGLLAAGGTAMEAELGAEAEGMGAIAMAGGLFMMVAGLLLAATWGMLLVSGIGVLKLAPWGRTLSLVSSGIILVLFALSMLADPAFFTLLPMGYGFLQFYLFFQPHWKVAFAKDQVFTQSLEADQDFRQAA